MALHLEGLGRAYWQIGEPTQAETLFRRALELFHQLGHRGNIANMHNSLATLYLEQEDSEAACRELETALDLYEEMGQKGPLGQACKQLADMYFNLDVKRAELLYRRALDVYQDLQDEQGRGGAYVGLGNVAAQRGNANQAIGMWIAASKLFEGLGLMDQAAHLAEAVQDVWNRGSVRVA
jgi:tetratricopeptide (TPR) repeat protein